MNDKHIGRKADHTNRRQILARVIAGIRVHGGRNRHRGRVTQQNGVAIGCGFCREPGPDGAAGAAPIFHYDLLAECSREFVADDARHHRRAAARRERHDQGDRSAWIVIGAGKTRRALERQDYEGQSRVEETRSSPRKRGPISGFPLARE